MSTFNNRTAINYIKRLTPVQRRVNLEELLNAFPDDWLDDAIAIAQKIRQKRMRPEPSIHLDGYQKLRP